MKTLNNIFLFLLFVFCTKTFAQTSSTVILPIYSGLVKPDGTNEGGPLADQNGKRNRGFYTFDLSVIPAGKTLIGAELVLFCNNPTNTPEAGNSLVGIRDTPTLSNYESVQVSYADANDGPVYCEGITWKYSYNNFDFNPLAVGIIQGLIGKSKGQANFSFGFRAASTTTQSWNFHGYNVTTENVKARLVLTFDDTNNLPRAKFSADKNDIIVGQSVQFTDQSENGATAWAWDFNVDSMPGSKTSTLKNPSIEFEKYGEYSISLKATNQTGSNTIIKKNFIHVYTQPVADFSHAPSLEDTLWIQFKDLSSKMPTKWLWDFGDGSIDSIQNPLHQYATTGVYNVCLTVTNIAGDSSICKQVNLSGQPLGVGAFDKNEWNIYPNPFSDYIIIENLEMDSKLEIVDLMGKIIKSEKFNSPIHKTDFVDCPSGIYFLRISQKNKIPFTLKLLKS